MISIGVSTGVFVTTTMTLLTKQGLRGSPNFLHTLAPWST
jgi:hypothetical protein